MSNKKTSHQNQKKIYLIEPEINNTEIKNSELEKLNEIINYLKNNPQSVITITGQGIYNNTDFRKNAAESLADERAEYISEQLITAGIHGSRISIKKSIIHAHVDGTNQSKNRSTMIEMTLNPKLIETPTINQSTNTKIRTNSNIDMVFNGHGFADGGKSQASVIAKLWKNSDKNKIFFLTGGATPEGSPEKNNILAKKRAETLKKELEKLGVPADNIVINRKPNLNAKKASVEIDFYDRTTKVISSDGNYQIPFDTKSILERGQNLDHVKKKVTENLDQTLMAKNKNGSEMNQAQKQNQINNFKNNYSQMGYKIDGDPSPQPTIKMNIGG